MIQENFSLKAHNTFGVDVSAKYFAEASSEGELLEVLQEFKQRNAGGSLLMMILGGGSNILFTKDFEGLVLKLNLLGISEEMTNDEEILVTAKSSENWHNFVMHCVGKNFGGLENLALIPGNVGTSPMQNIGAYGVEIKDVFHSCKALNLETLEIEKFDKARCQFGYRDSFFKNEGKGKYIILEVTFKLKTKNHEIHADYAALHSELERRKIEHPTIQDIAEIVITIRESKLPNPSEIGNAGSFFKNPIISQENFEILKQQHPEIPAYGDGENIKVPAAFLIEKAGWKGRQIGNVATHEKQALVIVNKTGAATGKEIFEFSRQIIEDVEKQFGIRLEREVNIY
ncbi:UDP-N-acetylmuramate dehydrogenase [Cruoricaptor ignavus]|uniref:UDP-N-acetylenolpyruvoylglucosamine reductase n=1 Tax=Cruoricaptor ignavus TaxID=1118202 RepID=A0A7M1T6S9_9FLAO|nr:UDP-N-acetylmuramate dehydrogenase [Cruoricaptor ignavus]QOR74683.1 UDP-N-acetylmuramate dehydrogenase [Cruoricaptor ignavus]